MEIEAGANLDVEIYRLGVGNELQPTHGVEEQPQSSFSEVLGRAYETPSLSRALTP